MTDYHVHVGWYSDGYHSPKEVWEAEQKAGITDIFVSSTTTCVGLYKLVIREMQELRRIGKERVHLVLWLTPQMFHSNCKWVLPFILHSKVKWEMVKMHWGIHTEWKKNEYIVDRALMVAKKMGVDVLFHTGNQPQCEASVFEEIIANNSDMNFILAHGRPTHQCIELMSKYPNVMVDTAFMDTESLVQFSQQNLNNRVLFGTDSPINKVFYPMQETSDFILQQKRAYETVITKTDKCI